MTRTEPAAPVPRSGPAPVQGIGMLIGLLFLVLGACELIPGVTVDHQLFGLFAVSGAWTLVHLLTGAVAIFCSRSSTLASRFLVAGGVLYVILGLAGLLPLPDAVDDFMPMNTAGVCLALGLGTAMVILGAGWLRNAPGRER
ncbi:DUF4383 domain-containing protein [Amycolatopsis sp. NPDC088138]|uniref:DUF4383 domain-containing protein n=1 Tax=Amycolatopsis sp. NPDC088138 TaxID=3363938 RepID=UPI00381C76D8